MFKNTPDSHWLSVLRAMKSKVYCKNVSEECVGDALQELSGRIQAEVDKTHFGDSVDSSLEKSSLDVEGGWDAAAFNKLGACPQWGEVLSLRQTCTFRGHTAHVRLVRKGPRAPGRGRASLLALWAHIPSRDRVYSTFPELRWPPELCCHEWNLEELTRS